jgi:hypothetical protein
LYDFPVSSFLLPAFQGINANTGTLRRARKVDVFTVIPVPSRAEGSTEVPTCPRNLFLSVIASEAKQSIH